MRKFPPRRVLVPIDFSAPSFEGLKTARLLAGRWRAELELVHVNERCPAVRPSLYPEADREALARLHRRAEERLREAAAGCPRLSVRVSDGAAIPGILHAASACGAELIVLGTRGYSGLKRALLGSAAEELVRYAQSPVLTVRRAPEKFAPKRLLVPVNFMEYSDRSLAYALAFAESLRARVTALHVVEEEASPLADKEVLREHLELVLGRAEARGIEVAIEYGKPAESILRAAQDGGFGLIVLAAHRKPFWTDMVLGMTAERVLRHAQTPVLSLPSEGPPVGSARARATASAA